MRLKDAHMRNAQLKQAYNVQQSEEADYKTGVGVFQDRNDATTLIPLVSGQFKMDINGHEQSPQKGQVKEERS